ncbi:MAG: class I SAM-dependent methyltransferase [Rhodospirillales bacterium]|nr:class I SAM-dependent methyltransferase [Rhodospirillales bacterium]MCW8862473.1 class I SAM-dependent methyltransferase [Rhodospirillales bacterium]MCW9001406.1 class I SAM-dependent methyltransferase [Rhodospirillales bacterium]MCW9040425.1 class I SAM-dependent methyltransferase [Rhodospirillales bacterium]
MNDRRRHWEDVYAGKKPEEVSWYQKSPETSLALIAASGIGKAAPIIDVGGGASRLVDGLVGRGYGDITVLDIAEGAIDASKERLGASAGSISWVVADVTVWRSPRIYALWHDRAVFHFMTSAADRAAYIATLRAGLAVGGAAVLATFAPDGPEKCSGLPVRRYSPASLCAELGSGFVLEESRSEVHTTPAGGNQKFQFCRLTRNA